MEATTANLSPTSGRRWFHSNKQAWERFARESRAGGLRTNPNEPHTAEAILKRGLSQRIWELNEIGMCESLYQSWSDAERNEVKAWMKKRGSRQPTLLKQASNSLPSFL